MASIGIVESTTFRKPLRIIEVERYMELEMYCCKLIMSKNNITNWQNLCSVRLAKAGKADIYEVSVSLFTLPEQQNLI